VKCGVGRGGLLGGNSRMWVGVAEGPFTDTRTTTLLIYYNIRPLIGDKRLETKTTRFVSRDLFYVFRPDVLFSSDSDLFCHIPCSFFVFSARMSCFRESLTFWVIFRALFPRCSVIIVIPYLIFTTCLLSHFLPSCSPTTSLQNVRLYPVLIRNGEEVCFSSSPFSFAN